MINSDYNRKTRFQKGRVAWNKGVKGSVPGFKSSHTEESKNKISLAKTGRPLTLEHRRKISEACLKISDVMSRNGIKGIIAQYQKPTKPELVLSKILDDNKIKHIPQFLINGKFLVDEYLPDYNLIIEVDGTYWHSLDRVVKKDRAENAYLKKCGFKLVRVPEKKLTSNLSVSLLSEILAVEGCD